VVDNAGKSHVVGAEIEATWSVTDNLVLSAAYGWSRNELDEYFDTTLAGLNCNTFGWEGYTSSRPYSGDVTDEEIEARCVAAGDASGQRAPRVAEHTANIVANYERGISADLGWFFRTDLNFESKKYATVANLAHTGNMYIWNARVGLDTHRRTASLYVDNILDDDTVALITDFPAIDQSLYQRFDPAGDYSWFANREGSVNPTNFQLTPRRGRSIGILLQARFGN